MLATKKLPKYKIILYTAVIVILVAITGYILYVNFASNNTASLPLINITSEQSTGVVDKKINEFNDSELDFLTDTKFKKLRNNSQELVIEQSISNNPFTFQGQ